MSKIKETSELKEMSTEALNEELIKLRSKECSLRMQKGVGQLKDHSQFNKLRKDIARIKTILSGAAERV